MNTQRCCDDAASNSRDEPLAAPSRDGETHRLTFARRGLDVGGWIVPSAILALLPKCPACLAAYVAVWTGVGLSLSTATQLRAGLLIVCIASLLYLAARRLGRFDVVKGALLRAKSHLPTIRTKETAP